MARDKSYIEQAQSDAWDTIENFLDDIVEQARDGEVSDDLHNDYPHGDSYHHENHVDKNYDLSEAAKLLGELSDHEETDEGLWEGQEPRKAIATQAAYTYGNAVLSYWRDYINDLNEAIEAFEFDDDDDRERFVEWYVRAWVLLYPFGLSDFGGMSGAAWKGINDGEAFPLGVLADWIDEHDPDRASLARKLRELSKGPEQPESEDDDEPDDDGNPGGDDQGHRQPDSHEAQADRAAGGAEA